MVLVPQIARIAVVILAIAGFALPVCAREIRPGNGEPITAPLILPPTVTFEPQALPNSYSDLNAFGSRFGVQNGRLDFFSLRPSDGGEFKPLLRGGVGSGGLQLQLKW